MQLSTEVIRLISLFFCLNLLDNSCSMIIFRDFFFLLDKWTAQPMKRWEKRLYVPGLEEVWLWCWHIHLTPSRLGWVWSFKNRNRTGFLKESSRRLWRQEKDRVLGHFTTDFFSRISSIFHNLLLYTWLLIF